MVSSEVIAGRYTEAVFWPSPERGSPGPTHLIWGNSMGFEELHKHLEGGHPAASSLIHRPRIDQPEIVLFKTEGDCN